MNNITITTLNPARLLQWKPDQPETSDPTHGYTEKSRAMAMAAWKTAKDQGMDFNEQLAACAILLSSVRTLCQLSVPAVMQLTRQKLERMERLGLIRVNVETSKS